MERVELEEEQSRLADAMAWVSWLRRLVIERREINKWRMSLKNPNLRGVGHADEVKPLGREVVFKN